MVIQFLQRLTLTYETVLNFKESFYFCNNCKKIVHDPEDLYFVESSVPRGFCSEICIKEFYGPIVDYYEKCEEDLRKKYNCEMENLTDFISEPVFLETLFSKPNEIWHSQNEIGDEVFSFISKFEGEGDGNFFLVALCLVFENKPSFIFLVTATKKVDFLSEFKVGKELDNLEDFLSASSSSGQDMELAPELFETIESKKSSFLATLLKERSNKDIPYEDFYDYDKFMVTTLEGPDEVYTDKDGDGDDLFTYIKAHEKDGISFYYFVICLSIGSSTEEEEDTILPILGFPSLDGKTYKSFRKGRLVSGNLKS
jgi:hypothetical protein